MANAKAIELLTKLIAKIPSLKQLNHDNKEYMSWYYEVCDTLESIFSKDSVEYRRFRDKARSWNLYDSEIIKQERYLKELDEHEIDLKSIIRRQEIKKISKHQEVLKWFKSYLILKPWQWIKSHRILSIIGSFLIVAITLLGTNWATVQDNFVKLLEFFR